MRINPFESPYLDNKEKLDAAYLMVKALAGKAGVNFTESPVSEANDPEGWYSPINMVMQSLDPETAESLMDLLLRDGGTRGKFYNYAVAQLESDPAGFAKYDMGAGEVPPSWLEEREFDIPMGRRHITKKARPIDFVFEDWGYGNHDDSGALSDEAEDLGIDPDTMVEDLNWGKRRKKRPEF